MRKSKGTLLIANKVSTIVVQNKDANIICATKLKWKKKKSYEWLIL